MWEQDALTSAWAPRASLAERGLELSIGYTAEVLANPVGGVRRGTIVDALLELGVDVDLEKAVGWRGGLLHALWLVPHGRSLTERYVGDLGTISNLDADDGFRLFEAWAQQSVEAGPFRFSLRLGQMAADEEFTLSEYSALFLQGGFGPPVALTGNFPLPAYPMGALGARLDFELAAAEGLTVFGRAGIFDGNPGSGIAADPSRRAAVSTEFNRFGTHYAFRPEEGAFLIGELGVAFNQPTDSEAPGSTKAKETVPVKARGLAGRYMIGGSWHTDEFTDVRDLVLSDSGSAAAPAIVGEKKGDWSIYCVADQEIWREAGSDTDGVGVFARAVFTPEGRNLIQCSAEAGAVYRGLLQSEGRDALGLGVACYCLSERYADAVQETRREGLSTSRDPDYEAVVELTYSYQIAAWWSIQPDLQWIIHPGGSAEIDNALVVGLRSSIAF